MVRKIQSQSLKICCMHHHQQAATKACVFKPCWWHGTMVQKCFDKYQMDCHGIYYRDLGSPEDESYWPWWSSDFLPQAPSWCWNLLLWVKRLWSYCNPNPVGAHIHASLRINGNHVADPLTFHLVSSSVQNFPISFSCTLFFVLTSKCWHSELKWWTW